MQTVTIRLGSLSADKVAQVASAAGTAGTAYTVYREVNGQAIPVAVIRASWTGVVTYVLYEHFVIAPRVWANFFPR